MQPGSPRSWRTPPPESGRYDSAHRSTRDPGRHREKAVVSEFEQTLLFAATGVVLVGTVIVFAWQYFRGRGRGD